MKPIIKTFYGPAEASANSVALSQSLGGAGNLTLNGALVTGGVARFTPNDRIDITSVGDDSGITFTVVGKDPNGFPITETFSGANAATLEFDYFYSEVSQISASGATAGAVTVGNRSSALTEFMPLDWYAGPQTFYGVKTIGDVLAPVWTVTGTLDYVDNPEAPIRFNDVSTANCPTLDLVSQTGDARAQISWTPLYVCLLISGPGELVFTIVQFTGR